MLDPQISACALWKIKPKGRILTEMSVLQCLDQAQAQTVLVL
jgi:hypothetical protein